jgi:hypothetical protein
VVSSVVVTFQPREIVPIELLETLIEEVLQFLRRQVDPAKVACIKKWLTIPGCLRT